MNSEVNSGINPQPAPATSPAEQPAPATSPAGQNLFWVLLAVFAVLALDAAFRLSDLLAQRRQLDQARFVQAQNLGRLAEAEQAKLRLQSLAFEVAQISVTNEAARRIVQDFNIRFNPSAPAAAPENVPISPLPLPSNQNPTAASPLSPSPNPPPSSPSLLPAPNNLPPATPGLLPTASNLPPAP